MVVTINAYGPSTKEIRNLGQSTGFKAMLVRESYTPNTNIHDFRDDVATYEVSASGYTAGGNQLSGVTWTYDGVNKQTTMTANNLTWPAMPATDVRYVVIYSSTGTPAQDALYCYVDLGQTVDLTAQGLTVVWPTSGVYRLKVTT